MPSRGGRKTPVQGGEGGAPPEQERTPFLSGLIQDMGGGGGEDLHRPPTAGRSGSKGERGERANGRRQGEGAPPSLGGRGTPEYQARSIMSRIINQLPRRSTYSGQYLAPHRR